MDLPGLDYSRGLSFQAEIWRLFGKPVAFSEGHGLGEFFLVISIGRCKFRLTEISVGSILEAVLGGNAHSFRVNQLGDRVFKFSVSSKEVGFHIYKLKSVECDHFKVSFDLWSNGGPQSMNESQEQASGWTRVLTKKKKKKRREQNNNSYTDAVRDHHVLTRVNAIPVSEVDDEENEHEALERVLIDACVEPIKLSFAFVTKITNGFSKEIGRGGFGVVYLGILRNGKVAVKKLTRIDDISDKKFEDELICLRRAKHKNIVRVLGYCFDTSRQLLQLDGKYVLADVRRRFLCFEYVPNKSLHNYLKDGFHGCDWDTCYQIIVGICKGLCYLHNEQGIVHLDLKPENILLDVDMVPKITDFGLSRLFSGDQSRIITTSICGTLGYTAPEYLDKGEISFKSDIYSLGIIIMKLIRGSIDLPDLQNWHQLLDLDCRKRTCIKIALLCVDNDQCRRPTIDNIIDMLNGKETVIEMVSPDFGCSRNNSGSSQKEATSSSASDLVDEMQSMSPSTASFPLQRITGVSMGPGATSAEIRSLGSTEVSKLLDVHPLELCFPFQPDKLIERPVTMTNRTDRYVGFWIVPTNKDTGLHLRFGFGSFYRPPHRQSSCFQIMEPHSTWATVMTMDQPERPPWDTCKYEVLMIVTESEDLLDDLDSDLTRGKVNVDKNSLVKRVEESGGEVHRAMVTAVICDPSSCKSVIRNQKFIPEELDFRDIRAVDVHPTETWILMALERGPSVSIWNYRTRKIVMHSKVTRIHTTAGLWRLTENTSDNWFFVFCPKFIAREQWFAAGDTDGYVHVYAYTTEDKIKKFKAHTAPVTELVVHPTSTFLLTSTTVHEDKSIKLWDWRNDWICARIFNNSGTVKLKWHPRDTNTFASVSYSSVEVWDIHSSHPTAALVKGAKKGVYLYTESHPHLLVTLTSGWRTNKDKTHIWDMRTEECVHRLGVTGTYEIDDVVCHPTLPILAIQTSARTICLWDAKPTYRTSNTSCPSPTPTHATSLVKSPCVSQP